MVVGFFLYARKISTGFQNTSETRRPIIKKISFKQEFRKFLNTYDVDYDERYVWD